MIGETLSHYKVVAALGAGGMGEVYRATDTHLGRDVAIKVLPNEVAQDPERLARFKREAQLLAALNHPRVAAIHGLEEHAGKPFLVLELISGEDLSERLKRGPIPMTEAFEIARQIAEALEAAHEKGIVHRDLKPSNIKLTADGQVKVLDFGLAKAYSGEAADGSTPELSHSPTLTRQGTLAGVILGTAAYMSPEQASGKPVDKRADVWAFGVVLFEMLTGRQLFTGETASEVLASVIKEEPDWAQLPPETPAVLRKVLLRCLQKSPRRRLHDIADARLEIEEGVSTPDVAAGPAGAGVARQARGLTSPLAIAGGLALLAIGALGAFYAARQVPDTRVLRFDLRPPAGAAFALAAESPGAAVVSPDGRAVAFAADLQGKISLFVRRLDSTEPRALEGTDDAQYPFWSPDSRFIGFTAGGKLKKIDTAGGPPVALCDAPEMKGASWGSQGVIVFAPNANSPIVRVPDGGGEPTPVTRFDAARKDDSHRHPRFLPDGRHFLYLVRVGGELGEKLVAVGSIDAGPEKVLLRSPAAAEYGAGHLLFLRDQTLMARPFDPKRLELGTEAFPVAENVRLIAEGTAQAVFSVSAGDVLAYQTGPNTFSGKLVWRDRSGRELGALGDVAAYSQVALSPKADFAAVAIGQNRSLWVYEIARNLRTRFTFESSDTAAPAWTPTGDGLIYGTVDSKSYRVYRQALHGSGAPELLLDTKSVTIPSSVSPDGRSLAFFQLNDKSNFDLWMLPLSGDHKPYPFLKSSFDEAPDVFSPDGRWIAYGSNESGRWEVYVTSFPKPGRKWQMSNQGGGFPLWRADGRELYYQALDGTVIAVGIEAHGDDLGVAAGKPLFKTSLVSTRGYMFAAAPDGGRFLIIEPSSDVAPQPLTVVVNWLAGAKR